MNNIAIITARSGSKGLKDKNVKMLMGKPLMVHTIEAALKSKMFDSIYVSTDSQIYADIAYKCGAEVPFLRSEELASDTARSIDVIRYSIEKYAQLGKTFDNIMVLQPTSPLRTSNDIRAAFKLFEAKKAKSIVSVCEMEHSPLWCNTLDDSLNMNRFLNKARNVQRQQLDTYYRINGAIYLYDVDFIMKNEDVYTDDTFAYIMPKERSIDIDDEMDFMIAENIMRANLMNNTK